MEFLSNLSTMQRGAGAVVLVLLLVLLLVKQRQAKAAPAGASEAKAAKAPKRVKASSSTEKKPRTSFGKRRARRDDGDAVADRVAEPKSGSGRMVPRLPAASGEVVDPMGTAELDTADEAGFAESSLAEPMTASDSGMGMINEPGWPTPGEVWAPDAPVQTASADESWQTSANGGGDHDGALTALTELPEADPAGWVADDSEEFDPATGWGAEAEDASPIEAPAAVEDDSWARAQEEEFDWATGDTLDGWAASSEPAPEELTTAEAAWESPEDGTPVWNSTDEPTWEAPAAIEEPPAPTATAVAEPEEEPVVAGWHPPAEEAEVEELTDEHDEVPALVWEPVDEVEAAEDAAELMTEPVVEDPTPVPAPEPIVVEPVGVEADPVTVEPGPAPVAFEPEPYTSEPVTVPDVADVPAAEPAVFASEVPVSHDSVVEAVEPADEVEVADTSAPEVVYGAPMALAGSAVADPVTKWASMSPGGVESRPAPDPVSSWSRLRPGQVPPANGGSNGHRAAAHVAQAPAASPVSIAMAPSAAPSVAWWDVPSGMESDPRRGRFALGGYALQAGHQVISGVTFRDGVVPPPSHWVIGPVVGAVAPGTLVLEVDGCLNCRPEDLAVLMDPGFAPTTDGFSLKLMAAAQGPFAASGTYVIS